MISKNQISKLYNAVSAPVAASRDGLAERLQSVRDTASLLYKRAKQRNPWALRYNKAVQRDPWALEEVPDQYKTQEMCIEAVQRVPWMFDLVPGQYKTQEMCNKAVEGDPDMFEYVPDQYKTQEMCLEAVRHDECNIIYVPDDKKTWKICKIAAKEDENSIMYFPEVFRESLGSYMNQGWDPWLEQFDSDHSNDFSDDDTCLAHRGCIARDAMWKDFSDKEF